MNERPQFPTALTIYLALLAILMLLRSASARAGDLEDSAQHLSDSAFSLLRSIDSSKPGGADALGVVASFAGDAQTFSGDLNKGDRRAASAAMTSMLADSAAVDGAINKNPDAFDRSAWKSLKDELASLERRVPPGKAAADVGSSKDSRGVVRAPSSEGVPDHGQPKVEISSRVYEDGGVHIKGYLAGYDLRSAGIYDGDRQLSAIQLSPNAGGQRVNFDLALEQATSTETIRVTDSYGRTAEARVAPQIVAGAPREGSREKMIDLGHIEMDGPSSGSSLPPVIASAPVGAPSGGTSTTEIPSRSPSKRHMHEHSTLAPLSGVQISILGVMQSPSNPDAYQVVGQISGEGVKRAGIYVDGKLVKPIPISADGFTAFDVIFDLLGRDATIRVYGNGTNYQEASIDLSTAGSGTVYGTNPPVAPYGYPVNPYAARNPYGSPYGAPYAGAPYGYGAPPNGYPPNGYPPNGYPPNGYPPNGYPPPSKPWWQKIF